MPNSPGLVRQRRPTRRRRSSSNCSASSPINIGRSASPQARRRQASRSSRELAGLRFLVLSHIEELEKKLEKLDPIPDLHNFPNRDGATPPLLSNDPSTSSAHQRSNENNVDDLPTWDSEFDFSVEDLRTWVHDSLEQLAHLRSEVSARLPDLEEVKSHFPDFEFDFELPNLNVDEFLARLSRMEVPNLSSSFGDVTSRIGDLGYEYLPALSERLHNLHSHLKSRSSRLPNGSEFRTMALDKANTILRDFIDTLMYNEEDSPLERTRVNLEVEQTVVQVQQALRTSMFGQRLISYDQLPLKWRNNEHVLHGYRFIPASEWPTLLLSTFHLHNETANIHTHLLPLLILGPMFAYEAYTATSALTMLPTTLFSIFAMLCLLTSVVWHICAGCASPQVMETAARIDYLGIGWLISASIATIVYYSFSCRKMAFSIYLGMNILAGLAGSILPFMQWFNERKHKKWRIVFFLSLALTAFIPIVHMCMIHSAHETLHYILPIVPSLASYIIGLLFYAFHFPECLWPAHHHHDTTYEKEYKYQQPPPARWTDWVGGGSHAIWHTFIVAAILLHRNAIPTLTKGLGGECCDVWGRY